MYFFSRKNTTASNAAAVETGNKGEVDGRVFSTAPSGSQRSESNADWLDSAALSRSERTALFAVLAVSICRLSLRCRGIPVPSSAGYELLQSVGAALCLTADESEAFLEMAAVQAHTTDFSQPFELALSLRLTPSQRLDLLSRLLSLFLSQYDAMVRALCRDCAQALHISTADYVYLEHALSAALFLQYQRAQGIIKDEAFPNESDAEKEVRLKKEREKARNKKMIRYAKIGVASLGAGAILAVTGGLAAPALAGALVLLGTGTLAATVSLTTAAAVFGGVGGGLTAYKMAKRTRGLTEFQFLNASTGTVDSDSAESGNTTSSTHGDQDVGRLSVMIVVSGWQREQEDDLRAFGVVPGHLSIAERLFRFYAIHAPDRIDKVAQEALDFADDPDSLYDELKVLLEVDPRDENALLPHASACWMIDTHFVQVTANALGALANASSSKTTSNSSKSKGVDQTDANAKLLLQRLLLKSDAFDELCQQRLQLTESPLASDSQKPATDCAVTEETAALANVLTSFPALSDESNHDTSLSTRKLEDNNDNDNSNATLSSTSVEAPVVGVDELQQAEAQDEKESLDNIWFWTHRQESLVHELYVLRWETALQREMGRSILKLIRSFASSAVQNVLAATVLTALASAVMWPAFIIKLTDVIDNSWTIAIERADLAGKELAKALLSGCHGNRPVTLVGYSFGARVIFTCLRTLAAQLLPSEEIEDDNRDAARSDGANLATTTDESTTLTSERATKNSSKIAIENLVQDVVLLGSPINAKSRVWKAIRRLVVGRVVNGYSPNDLVLGVVYRYQRFQYNVSGVTPVAEPGIENIDLSSIVSKHTDYGHKMSRILDKVDLCGSR